MKITNNKNHSGRFPRFDWITCLSSIQSYLIRASMVPAEVLVCVQVFYGTESGPMYPLKVGLWGQGTVNGKKAHSSI
ncbi:hypothetical protein HUJ05_012827 [Dendroctonus ponderosae]|nr:hypothetical protein HUJ05_012827 [Dendroctonus ponderosae]